MFIIDLRNKYVSDNHFSVVNNNNVDVVYIYSHFIQYANYSIYLKVRSADETFVDKIAIESENIRVEDDALIIKWTMGAISTQFKKINIQLQFEDDGGNYIAQSRIVSIVLADTIDVDKEAEEIYPSVLTSLQNQIDSVREIADASATKLATVESGAEANVIEGIAINGNQLTPDSNKIVY